MNLFFILLISVLFFKICINLDVIVSLIFCFLVLRWHIQCIAGPPHKPIYLRSTQSTLNEIELQWISGSNDCTHHTYVISYRHAQQQSSEKLLEVQHSAAYTDPQIHIIPNLQPSCSYEIKMSARNDIGYSQETAVIIVSTISSGNL